MSRQERKETGRRKTDRRKKQIPYKPDRRKINNRRSDKDRREK